MLDGTPEVAILPNEFGPYRRARPASMTDMSGTASRRQVVKVLPEGWTRERVEERMLAAGRTLRKRKLPKELLTLARIVSAYPAIIHDRHDHALWQPQEMTALRPTAVELTELDVFLGWLLWIGGGRFLFAPKRRPGGSPRFFDRLLFPWILFFQSTPATKASRRRALARKIVIGSYTVKGRKPQSASISDAKGRRCKAVRSSK